MIHFSGAAPGARQLLFFCAGLALAGQAAAALGQPPSFGSPSARRSLQSVPAAATAAVATPKPYTVVETPDDAGVTVREYVNEAGNVFAVSWRGPARPDLAALLGAGPYAQLVDAPTRRRGPVMISQPDLVIRSGGHMGDLHGSAWVPSLVPAGVDAGALP